MRWMERIAGVAAGAMAVIAAIVCFTLPAALVGMNDVLYGPGISDGARAALLAPVALAVVAALVLAVVALLDARRSEAAGRNWPLAILGFLALVVLAAAVGDLLIGPVALTTKDPSVGPASAFFQINAGVAFVPTLLASALCLFAALRPRPAAPTPATVGAAA